MSSRRKTSTDSGNRSFVGYSGLDVLSHEGSSQAQSLSNHNLSYDIQTQGKRGGRTMDDVSSFHSVSVSDMQPSIDVSSGQQAPLSCHGCRFNKSIISTLMTFIMMIIGIILVRVLNAETTPTRNVRIACQVIRAAGLFGFTGGITNWIGVKLIFTRVSPLFCSGAIVKHFVNAREAVANFIIEAFFSPFQVQNFVTNKMEDLLDPDSFDEKLVKVIHSNDIAKAVEKRLDYLMATPEGLVLRSLGVSKAKLRPVIMRYITDMRSYATPLVTASMQSADLANPEKIREQVVDVIATRTQQISPQQAQKVVNQALYRHLSWLVLWGNVFGAIVGCISEIASIFTRGLPH